MLLKTFLIKEKYQNSRLIFLNADWISHTFKIGLFNDWEEVMITPANMYLCVMFKFSELNINRTTDTRDFYFLRHFSHAGLGRLDLHHGLAQLWKQASHWKQDDATWNSYLFSSPFRFRNESLKLVWLPYFLPLLRLDWQFHHRHFQFYKFYVRVPFDWPYQHLEAKAEVRFLGTV